MQIFVNQNTQKYYTLDQKWSILTRHVDLDHIPHGNKSGLPRWHYSMMWTGWTCLVQFAIRDQNKETNWTMGICDFTISQLVYSPTEKNAYVWVYMTSLIKFWVWISCPKVHSPPLKKHWHTLCFRSSLNILLIFSYRSPSLRDCLIATGLTIGTGHFQAQWYPLKYGLFFSSLYQRDNLNLCKWF